jgi:multisubunit Na+/H+ antiporter MnhF subunit
MIGMTGMSVIEIGIVTALVLTTIGGIAGCIRLMLGPSLADRVVSLDLVTVLLIAVAALLALKTGEAVYLDLGLALALVGFLATVAFARYAERRPERRDDRSEFRPKATITPAPGAKSER